MIQTGGHDGAEFVTRQRSDEVENRRVPIRPLILQPHKQPQYFHPGESVRLRQSEGQRAAVDGQLNVFGDDSHVVFPTLMMFYEPSEY